MTMDSSFHRTSVLVWMLLTTILGKYVIYKLKAWLVSDFMNWLSMGFSFIPLLWLIVSKKNHAPRHVLGGT
jgi:hypothetical protein